MKDRTFTIITIALMVPLGFSIVMAIWTGYRDQARRRYTVTSQGEVFQGASYIGGKWYTRDGRRVIFSGQYTAVEEASVE
jgi:hypothetical protein